MTVDAPSLNWHYMAPHEGGLWPTDDPDLALRREWWYDPSNTYVYQVRETVQADWGPLLGEFEDVGYPLWVEEEVEASL